MIQSTLLTLSRKYKQITMVLFDVIAIIGSIFIAFSIRVGYWFYPTEDSSLMMVIFTAPLLSFPIFYRFGIYREVVRYVGFEALWRISQATTLYVILWGLFALMTNVSTWSGGNIPRSVILINWLVVLIVIGGSRLLARWFLSEVSSNNASALKKNVLIYGAGSSGRQLCIALKESTEYQPVAFIDDSFEIYNHSINGLLIYSQDDVPNLIKKNNIKEVLLAMQTLTRVRRNEMISFLESFPVVVRSIPNVSALAQGKVKVNDLLEIDITDLLGRDPVKPNSNLIKTNISNKVVMVTGAGGSIGSELCRQIISLKPKKLILFDISESSIYQIDQELLKIAIPGVKIFPVIGSISNKNRVSSIINFYSVNTIYHAAAYKHVPIVEFNKSEGVYNNAIGTKILAEAAILANVEIFVLISTDKAVRPTSIMGASKRIAELVLQAFSEKSTNTCFTMVRFGNVLDSSGSVIPLFRKQIKDGGPVTVTHADVIRYFMTIPEAVELVIQAGSMAKGGEVFVLDMGDPIKIYDLAVKMIKLSGLQVIDEKNPDGDISIKYSGLRPGEKLYEELLVDGVFALTEHKLIMQAEEKMISWDKLEPVLTEISEASYNSDIDKLCKLVNKLVPGYKPK
jgi:FlaA1/EpsC-like NDP-sugar epimerase